MRHAESDGNGGVYIRRSAFEKGLIAVISGIGITVISAGIIGEVIAYGERREIRNQVAALTQAVKEFADSDKAFRERYERRHEELVIGLTQVKARQDVTNKKLR